MIVDLNSFEGSSRAFEVSLRPDVLELDLENARLLGNVHVKGEITKHIAHVDVNGSIDADAEIDCVRCLQPVESKLDIDFDVSFVTEENFAADTEKEIGRGDLDTDVFSGDFIDLREIAREQILLNLPEQFFCKEDCKGLCPKCGANLNLIDCSCEETEIDPRWAALKDLK